MNFRRSAATAYVLAFLMTGLGLMCAQAPRPPVSQLSQLTDVQITGPINGQVLTYDSGILKWKNATGGGGAPGGTNGQLQYNNAGVFGGFSGSAATTNQFLTGITSAGVTKAQPAFSNLSGTPTTLAGYGITDAQPLDSDLTAIAALTTTSYGRGFLPLADATAARTYIGAGTGNGTVTNFSAGDLAPLFTTTEATTTTTPALSFALSTAAANTVFGNNTGSTAAPAFQTLVDAQVPDILTLTRASNLTTNGFVKTSGGNGTLGVSATVATTEGGIPAGGTTGQALTKINATDYNTQWTTLGGGSGTVTSITATAPIVVTPTPLTTTGVISVTGAALTKTDDTNVTLTLGGTPATALLQATSLTLGWTGTLSIARGGTGAATAAANTVFGNNTGSTAAPGFQSLVSAQLPTTISGKTFSGGTIDNTNTINVLDGSFTLQNSASTTKQGRFNLTNVTAGQTRTTNWPDSTTNTIVVGSSAGANQFATGISGSTGAISYAQPAFSNLSGSATVSQLPVMVASGGSHAAGIVPDPGATAGTTKFLREDATWVVPAGGGGGSPGGSDTQVQFNDGGSFGGDAGMTYDKTNDRLLMAATSNVALACGSTAIGIGYDGNFGGGLQLTANSRQVVLNAGNFLFGSGFSLQWGSSGDPDSGGFDTAITRNAAGVVEINNGTAGQYRDLIVDEVDAKTGFKVNAAAPNNYELTGNGTDFVAKASDIPNGSSAQQTGFASNTYLAGSVITVNAGDFKVGSTYRCVFDMAKTTAGTAAPVVTIYVGTNGSTADTAVQTISWAAATGVADTGTFEVFVNFRAVGASATVASVGRCIHNLAATGLTSTGASGSGTISNSTSSTFNSTAATKIGIAFNGGASYVGTNNIVQAYYAQP